MGKVRELSTDEQRIQPQGDREYLFRKFCDAIHLVDFDFDSINENFELPVKQQERICGSQKS